MSADGCASATRRDSHCVTASSRASSSGQPHAESVAGWSSPLEQLLLSTLGVLPSALRRKLARRARERRTPAPLTVKPCFSGTYNAQSARRVCQKCVIPDVALSSKKKKAAVNSGFSHGASRTRTGDLLGAMTAVAT